MFESSYAFVADKDLDSEQIGAEFEAAVKVVKVVKESRRASTKTAGISAKARLPVVGISGKGVYSHATHKRIYICWKNMLRRINGVGGSVRVRCYEDVSVSEEFLNFQNFAAWYEQQIGSDLGYHLDKDIMQAKVYSAETCILVPREINYVFRAREVKKAETSGVEKSGKKYRARTTDRSGGKLVNIILGYYDTPEEAFMAYKMHKEAHAKRIACKWYGKVDQRAINALMSYEVHIDGTFTCNPMFTDHELYCSAVSA